MVESSLHLRIQCIKVVRIFVLYREYLSYARRVHPQFGVLFSVSVSSSPGLATHLYHCYCRHALYVHSGTCGYAAVGVGEGMMRFGLPLFSSPLFMFSATITTTTTTTRTTTTITTTTATTTITSLLLLLLVLLLLQVLPLPSSPLFSVSLPLPSTSPSLHYYYYYY